MRLQWLGGLGDQTKSLIVPGLGDGDYAMRQFDIRTGVEKDAEVKIIDGRLSGYKPNATDEGVVLIHKEWQSW
jgi:hypothetical protein